MRYFTILLILLSVAVKAETVIVPIPDGMIAFWSFDPKTELENRAFEAAKEYLKNKKENLNKYYLAENGLDVETDLYHFYIIHTSNYRKKAMIADESDKNGVLYYSAQKDKVVKFKSK
ncbi:hypothetical protein [Pseudoalteromonas sp. T1lg23B]|uniref:hypothetical protein n=1 Tax=Pseudoalteromonas sp. T1lg23B TaxID=2077097 RepID=UPI000CF6004B|nr:hypothetical protein [Pseudoalteromonas sp. T1lg23B]